MPTAVDLRLHSRPARFPGGASKALCFQREIPTKRLVGRSARVCSQDVDIWRGFVYRRSNPQAYDADVLRHVKDGLLGVQGADRRR